MEKTAEARACLHKAKLHLNNSRNLKTDIKHEVVDRLYNLVRALKERKKGNKGHEAGRLAAELIPQYNNKVILMK